MDKSALIQAMKASISEVLEQMFFMTVDLEARTGSVNDPPPAEGSIIAGMGFSGSPGGRFILWLPDRLARTVAADFLGVAVRNLPSGQVAGTVLEMLNMLAGGTLSRFDPQALFDLQMPEMIDARDWKTFTGECPDPITIRIRTLQSPMMLQLLIH